MARNVGRTLLLAAAPLLLALAVACEGDETEPTTPAAETPPAQAADTQPSAATEEIRDKLSRVAILTDDLGPGFTVLSDEYIDNAQAAVGQADPTTTQTFLDGWGRVLGRTVVYMAEDAAEAALAAQSVSFFSNVNAFEDTAGASQYYAVATSMIDEGAGTIANFEDLFVDVSAVRVEPYEFPSVGDESSAFTLTGDTEAEGQIYSATVLLVALREGPVTAFVGSVRIVVPPDVPEVERLAQLLIDRIDEEF
jgi:hypothetical protein